MTRRNYFSKLSNQKGTGHGNDLGLLFDYTDPEKLWNLLYCGERPLNWHVQAAEWWGENWIQFSKYGTPQMTSWSTFDTENLSLMHIRNNASSAVFDFTTGRLPEIDYWLNK